jgi:hypothetical protein
LFKNAINKKKLKEKQKTRQLEEDKLRNDLSEKENHITQIKNKNNKLGEMLQEKRREVERKDKELMLVKAMVINKLKDHVFDIESFNSICNECVLALNDYNESCLHLYSQEVEYNVTINDSKIILNNLKEEIEDLKEELTLLNASS